jgi:hypothetical protein
MTNILVGSSNVARFYKVDKFKDFRQYNMAKCTTFDSFKATMTEIEEGTAIVSVFENIIVDAAKGFVKDNSALEKAVLESIDGVLSIVQAVADKMPGTKIAVVTPLERPAISWFQDKGALIYDHIKKSMAVINSTRDNTFTIECMCKSLQQFEKDGVHLTEDAGVCFIEDILSKGEKAFNSETINLAPDDPTAKPHTSETPTIESTNQRIDDMVGRLTMRFDSDNLMFARIREELDSAANLKREDRVVVNGITCKQPLPLDSRQRLEKLKELVMEIFIAIKPDFKGKILFASQGRSPDISLPSAEVKIDKVEHAIAIRKAFAIQKKNGGLKGSLEKVFIANSVNPATRVRIEIMKAIAKKISCDDEQAYVVGFIPRPVMHIRKKGEQAPSKTYSFVDAIKYHGGAVKTEDLGRAYARAGRAFDGQLLQNFVLLNDTEAGSAQNQFHEARQARGGGRGRGSGHAPGRTSGPNPGTSGWRRGGGGGHGTPPVTRGEKRKGDEASHSAPKK